MIIIEAVEVQSLNLKYLLIIAALMILFLYNGFSWLLFFSIVKKN